MCLACEDLKQQACLPLQGEARAKLEPNPFPHKTQGRTVRGPRGRLTVIALGVVAGELHPEQ